MLCLWLNCAKARWSWTGLSARSSRSTHSKSAVSPSSREQECQSRPFLRTAVMACQQMRSLKFSSCPLVQCVSCWLTQHDTIPRSTSESPVRQQCSRTAPLPSAGSSSQHSARDGVAGARKWRSADGGGELRIRSHGDRGQEPVLPTKPRWANSGLSGAVGNELESTSQRYLRRHGGSEPCQDWQLRKNRLPNADRRNTATTRLTSCHASSWSSPLDAHKPKVARLPLKGGMARLHAQPMYWTSTRNQALRRVP